MLTQRRLLIWTAVIAATLWLLATLLHRSQPDDEPRGSAPDDPRADVTFRQRLVAVGDLHGGESEARSLCAGVMVGAPRFCQLRITC